MGLEEYRRKRDFGATPEPSGRKGASDPQALSFVVQRHDASRLHFDFRLELDGVLLSWAVPKGPSLDPGVKRLAVRTEDHPLDYGDFEGIIPEGQYGGGSVMLWDRGTWQPRGDAAAGLAKGHIRFTLSGERLKGDWSLVRTGQPGGKENWLLFKVKDEHAKPGDADGAVKRWKTSIRSGLAQDQIAKNREHVWTSEGELPSRDELLSLPGARRKPLPWPLRPELPTLRSRPIDDDGWVHEIKLDGYRMLLRRTPRTVRIISRNGQDWTNRLRELTRAIQASLPVDDAVLDGELVWIGTDGRSDFGALQRTLGRDDPHHFFVAFDLLQLHGVDLRDVALRTRKELLQRIVPPQGRLRYGAHVEVRGSDVAARACELEVEGIVSKRADAPYRSGRSRNWFKVKCHGREDFLVVGYLVYKEPLSSLLLAQEDPDGLRYVGRVGTGFSDAVRKELRARLDAARVDRPPLEVSGAPRETRWVRPELRVEVRYGGWTEAGVLRHASFLDLREDSTSEPPDMSVQVTHPDRVIYPNEGITKGDLAAYYARFAHLVLGQVARRPLTLVRCPSGIGQCFHQKHLHTLPKAVRPVDVGGDQPYVYIEDADGLLALVQNGVVEIHPWGSTVDRLEKPDRIIMDLDPDEDLPREAVVHAAWEVRALLEELGLVSFPKLTGGKGIHVVVPIEPRSTWPEVKAFAKALSDEMSRRAPARYVATFSKKKREGRIYVDYLRNQRDATAVAAWSARARPGARVALPLSWRDLDPDAPAEAPRLDRARPPEVDPWGDLDSVEQRITAEMRRRLEPRK